MKTIDTAQWQKLVQDPNDIHALIQWIDLQERKGGEAGPNALGAVAALPNSWLAKIWTTRRLLAEGHLERSLAIYKEVVQLAPQRSLAVQEISGHLGEAQYFEEAIDLLVPIYSADDHGPFAGFNLFNACEDAGDLESAQIIIDRMKCSGADWPQEIKAIVRIRQAKLNVLFEMEREDAQSYKNN